MIATYDIRKHLANFEFFNWLVMVKAAGATKIVIDDSAPKIGKFSEASIRERVRSILLPGPSLARLPCRSGMDQSRLDAVPSQLLQWYQAGGRFSRLHSFKPAVYCTYTVTIRDNFDGAPNRNSNREAWYKFADEIGATIIEDYFVKKISLHDRMALYAGAKMNFGVCTGPMHLLSLTPYPVTIVVNSPSARNNTIRWGMKKGESFPWMISKQTMVWEDDSFDNLRRMWDRESIRMALAG